ncbi:immediate early response 3-interacting protein 1-like [Choloepus didactylus]|uniref:immediate early response 3-interacting protein 1-like n=1 Tax=Choloepus didactylus TaxID=27675 RepID=UPI00189C7A55|nr:immediate early response 3-interacting protein 1-like [Choloepus didactylus]
MKERTTIQILQILRTLCPKQQQSHAFTLDLLLQVLCSVAVPLLYCTRSIGWGTVQGIGGFGEEPGIKPQLMNHIRSVRTMMRVPSITVNSTAIVLLLFLDSTVQRPKTFQATDPSRRKRQVGGAGSPPG